MDDSDSDSANNILNREVLMGIVSTNAVLAMPFVVLFFKRGRQ